MIRFPLLIIFCLLSVKCAFSQYGKIHITTDNISRSILINDNHIHSDILTVGNSDNLLRTGSDEFSISINDKTYTGQNTKWIINNTENIDNSTIIKLKSNHKSKDNFSIRIIYKTYPNSPVIRKRLSIENTGPHKISVKNVQVERLRLDINFVNTWVMHNYARQKHIGQRFVSSPYDPLVIVHEFPKKRGIAFGNEASGVTKHTTVFHEDASTVTVGLTPEDHTYPTAVWLDPQETWESPWTFMVPYTETPHPYTIVNGPVNGFVREHMGIRLAKITTKPVFVYNTWEPFRHDIKESLIKELADAAAASGMEEFIIDDGWQTNYGDWDIDPEKFPNGLKPVFDYIKAKGMKPGLWISIAAAQTNSSVYNEHREWLVRKENGDPVNLHSDDDKMYSWSTHSMCMSSGWYDHIKKIILKLIEEHGLEYIKADFAVVSGAYTINKNRSGCYAANHLHHDRPESMIMNYDRLWDLFDELHEAAPTLFIDCTFEVMGSLQLIDYAMCKHAEGNWLSNFLEQVPLGSLRVRQMAWWRSPVMPATALVIGNQAMDDPNIEESIKSLAGSLPILLGDPRKLTPEQQMKFKQWGDWLRSMQARYDIMMYRQDLPGFGEPTEGSWDGFQRINTSDKSGGIIGIFRQGSSVDQEVVTVEGLNKKSRYQILEGPSNIPVIESITGEKLENEGFTVTLEPTYSSKLFEIREIK